jgi:hypothetical protein
MQFLEHPVEDILCLDSAIGNHILIDFVTVALVSQQDLAPPDRSPAWIDHRVAPL